MITKAIKITKDQYNKGYIAIDQITADNYLIIEDDGICLWLGIRAETLMNCTSNKSIEVRLEHIVDEVGCYVARECYIINTGDCIDELDLDELSKGNIVWL